MRSPAVLAAIAAAVIIVGGALLKGVGDQGSNDPTASAHNGAPRGLLALHLLLSATRSAPQPPGGRRVDVVTGFHAPVLLDAGDAVLIMPPERSAWTGAEAEVLMDAVRAGAHVVIACDDDDVRNARLLPLLKTMGVECFRERLALGDASVTRATGALQAHPEEALFVRGAGRVRPMDDVPAFPTWTAGADGVVVKRLFALRDPANDLSAPRGSVTVLGSATILTNDGLAREANAAFALRALAGDHVVIDERHHHSRSRTAMLTAAAKGAGPVTALLALLLLLPLSLLSLVPRMGDAPRDDEDPQGAPAAAVAAKALAALLAHAR